MKLSNFVIAGWISLFILPLSAIADGLTLRDALKRTLQDNPTLQRYPFEQRMAEAERLQASLRPNPRLGIELENIAGTGNNQGFDGGQATLSFSQLIELGDKRTLRMEYASASQRQLEAEFSYSKVEVLAEAAKRFYDVVQLQTLQTWAERQHQRLKQAQETARERVEASAVPASEVTRIRLQLQQVAARSKEINGELAAAKTQLSAMWATAPNFDRVAGKFNTTFDIPSIADVENAVNQAPEFLRLTDSQRLLEAKAQSIAADATSDLNVGVGVRYNNEVDDTSLVLQASMPLQLTNPNIGHVQANQAERDLLLEQQRWIREQLRANTKAIWLRLQTNTEYLTHLSSELIPIAQQLNREINDGYTKGIHSLLEVLDAQQQLAQLEYQVIERRQDIHQDFLELERMTGQSFLGSEQ